MIKLTVDDEVDNNNTAGRYSDISREDNIITMLIFHHIASFLHCYVIDEANYIAEIRLFNVNIDGVWVRTKFEMNKVVRMVADKQNKVER